MGLKVHRQLKVPGFRDSAGAEAFTKLLNAVFDILNAEVPEAAIRRGSPRIKVNCLDLCALAAFQVTPKVTPTLPPKTMLLFCSLCC